MRTADKEHFKRTVAIPVQSECFRGQVSVPANASALVLIVHTGGDSQLKQSDLLVQQLTAQDVGALALQIVTSQERDAAQGDQGFCHLGLLALRIVTAIRWASQRPEWRGFKLGCIGLGAGGTAALIAAGSFSGSIGALVVADAQPDLVGDRLMNIHAPTLIIAGATHDLHQRMNEIGFARLLCKKELELVVSHTPVHPEPDMSRVAALAANWFARHLPARRNVPAHVRHPAETFALAKG